MTTIRIKGGLGNQMFQYAYGRNLMSAGKKVIFDISFFKGAKASIDTDRPFLLDKFHIPENITFENLPGNPLIDLSMRILQKLRLKPYEFFQGERYFKKIEDAVREEFTLKNPLSSEAQTWLEKIKNSPQAVSLHIRRGDYVTSKITLAHHGTCTADYYQKALALIQEKLISTNSTAEIFVFSDDIKWAQENLNLTQPVYFVSNSTLPAYEEMYLMSQCKHNIIANSSFSWWGAWLNENPDKIVIAPKQWTTTKTANELDILPTTWTQL